MELPEKTKIVEKTKATTQRSEFRISQIHEREIQRETETDINREGGAEEEGGRVDCF